MWLQRLGGPSLAHTIAEALPMSKSKPTAVSIMHLFMPLPPFLLTSAFPETTVFYEYRIAGKYG
jgi:hypothetical protein